MKIQLLALDAVSRGLADAYIGNRAVVTYKLSTELINNLKIDSIDTTRIASLLTIGVPKIIQFYTLLFKKLSMK